MAKKELDERKRTLKKDEKPIFVWEAPESISQKRSSKWYVILFLVSVVLAYVFYIQDLLSGSVLVVVSALVLSFLSIQKPDTIKSALFTSGLLVNNKIYSYDQFKSFHLMEGKILKIRLQPINKFLAPLTLPITNENSVSLSQIVLFLSKKMPQEDDKGEDFVDRVNHFFHF